PATGESGAIAIPSVRPADGGRRTADGDPTVRGQGQPTANPRSKSEPTKSQVATPQDPSRSNGTTRGPRREARSVPQPIATNGPKHGERCRDARRAGQSG